MTIREAIADAALKLKSAGIESYILDSQLLLAHALNATKTYILTNPDYPLTPEETAEFTRLITQRQTRYPIQYILGKCEFMSLEFHVTPGTLIPRPDTETLVESLISLAPSRILEIGTGSGCIVVSLAKHLPDAKIDAIDISPDALQIAQQNAVTHGAQARINFIHADIFTAQFTDKYNTIVSNPPYIQSSEIPHLQPEVREHEPILALDGGTDGLNFYRRIAEIAPQILIPNGIVALELGHTQLNAVEEIFGQKAEIHKDLAGINRAVHFRIK